jgi:hypothetical protein
VPPARPPPGWCHGLGSRLPVSTAYFYRPHSCLRFAPAAAAWLPRRPVARLPTGPPGKRLPARTDRLTHARLGPPPPALVRPPSPLHPLALAPPPSARALQVKYKGWTTEAYLAATRAYVQQVRASLPAAQRPPSRPAAWGGPGRPPSRRAAPAARPAGSPDPCPPLTRAHPARARSLPSTCASATRTQTPSRAWRRRSRRTASRRPSSC